MRMIQSGQEQGKEHFKIKGRKELGFQGNQVQVGMGVGRGVV